jgi:hypothetical protein
LREANDVADAIAALRRQGPPSSLEGLLRSRDLLHAHLEGDSYELHLALGHYRQTTEMLSAINARIARVEARMAREGEVGRIENADDEGESEESDDEAAIEGALGGE